MLDVVITATGRRADWPADGCAIREPRRRPHREGLGSQATTAPTVPASGMTRDRTQRDPRGTAVTATQISTRRKFSDDAERLRADGRLFRHLAHERDHVARDAVVERFLPLARQLAVRYQRSHEPFDDIYQVACYGLIKAVDRFDIERGVAFTSYAVPTITGEIKRYFRDRGWAVRVPRDLQDLALRVDRVIDDLACDLGRQPSVDDLAQAAGVDPEVVLDAMQASSAQRATSLDAPRTSGAAEPDASISDTVGGLDDGYLRAEQRAVLEDLVRNLTRREREVLRLRFEEDLTQAQIAEIVEVSQMQVSRILRTAIAKLRTLSRTDTDLDDAA